MTDSDKKNVDTEGWQQGDNPSYGKLRPEQTLRPDAGDGQDRVAGKGKPTSREDGLLQSDTDAEDDNALTGDQPDDAVTGEPKMREVERKRDGDESSD